MEMPIQLIIVLFVVTIVGAMIVLFSQSIIDQSHSQLNQFNKDDPTSDFLDVASINDFQIAALVEECYNNHSGKSLNSETCFIIHSGSDAHPSKSGISTYLSDPEILGEVEEVVSKTFYIYWNISEGNVEVKT